MSLEREEDGEETGPEKVESIFNMARMQRPTTAVVVHENGQMARPMTAMVTTHAPPSDDDGGTGEQEADAGSFAEDDDEDGIDADAKVTADADVWVAGGGDGDDDDDDDAKGGGGGVGRGGGGGGGLARCTHDWLSGLMASSSDPSHPVAHILSDDLEQFWASTGARDAGGTVRPTRRTGRDRPIETTHRETAHRDRTENDKRTIREQPENERKHCARCRGQHADGPRSAASPRRPTATVARAKRCWDDRFSPSEKVFSDRARARNSTAVKLSTLGLARALTRSLARSRLRGLSRPQASSHSASRSSSGAPCASTSCASSAHVRRSSRSDATGE